jgi:N-glycosylase/DNA lyase
MVQHLKSRYGENVGEYAGLSLYTFPVLSKLAAEGVEGELRQAGFGYRAKYIQSAARHLIDSGLDLLALRTEPYGSVHEQLLTIPGVGPKVADCIALMSLDQLGAVPVDTHIWKVACTHYRFSGLPAAKSAMNKKVYAAIGQHFRKIFGPMAGWAHLVLFAAQSRLPRTSK